MKQEIEKFRKETGVNLVIKDGNPFYGGYLDLENCTGITALPDNLTVGDYLDLRGTGITGEVKVNKKLSSKAIAAISRVSNMPIFWEWNDRSYIKVDEMFTAVDSHHGNVYRVTNLTVANNYILSQIVRITGHTVVHSKKHVLTLSLKSTTETLRYTGTCP